VDFDFNTSNSLGMSIINNLILQLDADLYILNDIKGFGVHISFKNN
jgi:two-component sensor histidine kinase